MCDSELRRDLIPECVLLAASDNGVMRLRLTVGRGHWSLPLSFDHLIFRLQVILEQLANEPRQELRHALSPVSVVLEHKVVASVNTCLAEGRCVAVWLEAVPHL